MDIASSKKNLQGSPRQIQSSPAGCLYIWIECESSFSSDLHFKKIYVEFDDFEVDIDDEMLNGLKVFLNECTAIFDFSTRSGIPHEQINRWGSIAINHQFNPPAPIQVLMIDKMCIQRFKLVAWCSFDLESFSFINDMFKFALTVLMLSQKLVLKGAPLNFDAEVVEETIRVSLATLFQTIKRRYLTQVIKSMGIVLGYSSVANIPRAPLNLFLGTVGLGLTVADNLSTGVGSILSALTFDPDYIDQRQKASARSPTSLKEGLSTASKGIKDGIWHLSDFVTKPIGGAQSEGFAGLAKGIARGVVGTIVKPVDKLGQVVSSMASGIRAEYLDKPLGGYKYITEPRRKPRMLWGDNGMIREYDATDAQLRYFLGLHMAKNVLKCIQLDDNGLPQHHALLIYPKRICYVELQRQQQQPHRNSSGSSLKANPTYSEVLGQACLQWSISLASITDLKASSHGVIILAGTRCLHIPCTKASLIRRVYKEISIARPRIIEMLPIASIEHWLNHLQNVDA